MSDVAWLSGMGRTTTCNHSCQPSKCGRRESGFAESIAMLAVINGHPVMLVGYGDLSRFDEVARTLRVVEP